MLGTRSGLGVSYFNQLISIFVDNDMIETDLNSVSISADSRLLAVGDALGAPKVYTYPAHLPG